MIPQSEHQIQSAILEYCAYWGIKAWRMNAGRYSVGEGMNKRFIIGAPAGTPDIIGVLGKRYGENYGRMVAIEVKKPSKKPTDIQNRVIEELLAHGALVIIAHSVEEVEATLKNILHPRFP